MDFNDVVSLHKSDPALLALRKDWTPLVVGFLHYAFKDKQEVFLPQGQFREQLGLYLDHVNAMLPEDSRYHHDADYYLNRWSREDNLIRIRPRDGGHVVQLSPYAERLLGWFDDMLNRGMIGTESRLRNILSMLDELVARSTEDVEQRLRQLYDQREQIEVEIARIEMTQQVDGWSDVQIRERLDLIGGMARQLLRDFTLVEERFRDIARAIQQAQLDPDARRGDILGAALDADEQLENSDEGQSFRAFYELLNHPQQRDKFQQLIDAVFEFPRLSGHSANYAMLKHLTSYLLDAGEGVNRSKQRVAEHLRRVVDTRNLVESRRVQTLAGEIKHLTSQIGEDVLPLMNSRQPFYIIKGEPEIDLPLERPLYEPADNAETTDRPRPASMVFDADVLMALLETFYVDSMVLRDNIERLLMSRAEVTLSDVCRFYPIKLGISEVIEYVHIAVREPQHSIERDELEELLIRTPGGEEKSIVIPRIIFRRSVGSNGRGQT